MKILQISPQDLFTLQSLKKEHLILDVREVWEIEKASFKDFLHIPLSRLSTSLSNIPKSPLIITVCHHGVRSLKAASFLESAHKKALSLQGGIDAYAELVDPNIPRY